jgi:hypothetical protein
VPRLTVSFVLAAFLALLAVAAAPADGDPASDVLITTNVYLPYAAPPSKDVTAKLSREVAAVYARNDRIKVAVIATATDLGAIPSLFGKPTEYATFLGQELSSYYVGPLLIVMPAGFGIYDGGRSVAAESRVLDRMSVGGRSPDDLTRAAATAVRALRNAGALKSKDVRPPFVAPVFSRGARGKPMRLNYAVFDDSGRSRAVVTVLALPRKVLATFRIPLRSVRFGVTYSVTWRVPAKLPRGKLSLCVTAADASGNRAPKSCLPLKISY